MFFLPAEQRSGDELAAGTEDNGAALLFLIWPAAVEDFTAERAGTSSGGSDRGTDAPVLPRTLSEKGYDVPRPNRL